VKPETPAPVRLEDYLPSPYKVGTVQLDFRLDARKTRVVARITLSRREGTAPGAPLELDGDELVLKHVAIDGIALPQASYSVSPQRLVIDNPPAQAFSLEIETELDPEANSKLMGLYRSNGTWCTQCEADGFRRITYFLDRPDVLAVYTVRIEADETEAPILLSNGNPAARGKVEGTVGGTVGGTGRHYAVWHDPYPKPCYLFALVAGDLAVVTDAFTTRSGRAVELGLYVEHGNEGRTAYAMDALKRSMAWDEEVYGREYDLDVFNVVAVSDFNMGAMENKGLNIFNDKYVLADPEVATDLDYEGIERVIAHEYFHNWTGNRITCRDWFQLCLKEGLTVFRDQEFTADMRSRPVERIGDVRTLRSQQFTEDAGPLAHPVRPTVYSEINNFYTATVYEKGAEVIRMLRTLIGADAFRRGMDLYFERHDGEAATIEEFIACFEAASGRDLDDFMGWYRQAGTPVVEVDDSYDAATKTYRLTLEQRLKPTPGQPVKSPQVIPVRFGLVGSNGADMAFGKVTGAEISGDVLVMTDARHDIIFSGVGERPVPSVFRGFSAPVKAVVKLAQPQMLFLARHDGDPFNRWQAASSLAMLQLVALASGGGAVDADYLRALEEIAGDETLDPAFRALMLTPPSENDIAREIGQNVDPEAVSKAHRALKQAIGETLAERLDGLIEALGGGGAYRPDAESAGRRALGNTAADLRAASGDAAAHARVARRFAEARNMTDRLAALTTLVQSGAPKAEGALAAFYAHFKDVPLVVDKWLAVQAAMPSSDALGRVKALMRHPAFSMRNPNRIRSLIGTFAAGNPSQFGRADGAGFAFVADCVLELDGINPQVAARIAAAFRSWRTLEPGRRGKAEAALQRIAGNAGLSPDVTDIVTRSLA
jgi:aminopeptidase N